MPNDNIVSFSTRSTHPTLTTEAEFLSAAQAGSAKLILEHLDLVRERVVSGKTTGLIWIELTDDANESGFGMQLGPAIGYVTALGMLEVAKAYTLDALLSDASPDE